MRFLLWYLACRVRALQEQLDSAHSAPQPEQASLAEVAALRARVAELECAASWRPAGSPGSIDAAAASVASDEDDWAAGSCMADCRASSAGGSSRGLVTPEGSGERRPASMESILQEIDLEKATAHAAEETDAAIRQPATHDSGGLAESSLAVQLAGQPSVDDASMAAMEAEHAASQDGEPGMDNDNCRQPAEELQEATAVLSVSPAAVDMGCPLRQKAGLLAASTEQGETPLSMSASSEDSAETVLPQPPWVHTSGLKGPCMHASFPLSVVSARYFFGLLDVWVPDRRSAMQEQPVAQRPSLIKRMFSRSTRTSKLRALLGEGFHAAEEQQQQQSGSGIVIINSLTHAQLLDLLKVVLKSLGCMRSA